MNDDTSSLDIKHESALVKDIGLYSIKTVIALCGGGFLAMLTFLGTLNESTAYAADIEKMVYSLKLMLIGISFAIVTLLVSFLISQFRLLRLGPTWLDRHPALFLLVQAGPLLLGYGAFILGAFFALEGISVK